MSSLETKSCPPQKREKYGFYSMRQKTATLVLAAGLILLTFAGCNNSSPSDSGADFPVSGVSSIFGISSPVVIDYTVTNPLTFEEQREGNDAEFMYVNLIVHGLKDKEIEQKINDRIKAVYDGLRVQDIPPYRGTKAMFSGKPKITQEQVYASVVGNFNHILSITFSKYASYQDPAVTAYSEKDPEYDNSIKSFGEEETLNFDLNTGEEIKLKDMFCDDVDYMTLINDYMSRYLFESHSDEEGYYLGTYSGLKLVESFKGLSEDQKFAVYPYGISLIFDYNTPQFEMEGMSVRTIINFSEFGDHIAATERFYDGKKALFTSGEPLVKALVMKENNVRERSGGTEYYQDGGVNVYQTWSYPSDLPEPIRNKLEEMRKVDPEAVNRVKEAYSGRTKAELEMMGSGAYEVMVFGNRVGGFLNTSGYQYLYMPDYFEQSSELHCYDSATMKELKLTDVFREGYDGKPVIMEAIKKTLKDYDAGYVETEAGKDYTEQQYEAVYDQITGFNLDTETIVIPIVHPEKGNKAFGLNIYLTYQEIGCDNLTIFR